jgi:ubiquinone/menaquinone biosynthesis C-methylase UbiE
MSYWRKRQRAEGILSNRHYQPLYTDAFGVTVDDYANRAVLDIGCGPRGSLEWATMARERVGVDPLADRYRAELGASRHAMIYCSAVSHAIPYPDAHFDIVTSLNALDHVDDFAGTVREIERLTKPGGLFLLSVEIDHPVTATEPMTLTEIQLRGAFSAAFEWIDGYIVGTPADHDVHRAVMQHDPYVPGQPGIFVGRWRRQDEAP